MFRKTEQTAYQQDDLTPSYNIYIPKRRNNYKRSIKHLTITKKSSQQNLVIYTQGINFWKKSNQLSELIVNRKSNQSLFSNQNKRYSEDNDKNRNKKCLLDYYYELLNTPYNTLHTSPQQNPPKHQSNKFQVISREKNTKYIQKKFVEQEVQLFKIINPKNMLQNRKYSEFQQIQKNKKRDVSSYAALENWNKKYKNIKDRRNSKQLSKWSTNKSKEEIENNYINLI